MFDKAVLKCRDSTGLALIRASETWARCSGLRLYPSLSWGGEFRHCKAEANRHTFTAGFLWDTLVMFSSLFWGIDIDIQPLQDFFGCLFCNL